MGNFEDMMNRMAKDFDNAEAAEAGADVPDGEYVCMINSCTLNQSKASGRWQVSWDLQIVEDPKGRMANRHIFVHDGITTVQNGVETPNHTGMGIIKKRFRTLGMRGVNSSNLTSSVEQVVGKVVNLEQKTTTRGPNVYTNIYMNSLVANTIDEYMSARLGGGSPRTQQLTNQEQASTPAQMPKLQFEDDPPF